MGYTRDKNAATRGAGAIAARDMANPRAAMIRAAKRQHALSLRDKALSHMTYGNRGGIALGAISKASAGILKNMMSPTIATTSVLEQPPLRSNVTVIDVRPPSMPLPPPPPPLPPKPRPPLIRDLSSVVKDLRSKVNPAVLTPTVVIDPVRSPSGNTGVVGPKPPGVITGGGGGGGVQTNGNTGIVPPDFGPLPDVPDDAPDVISASSSNKTLLIAGAAALGAYLLFGRKKGSR